MDIESKLTLFWFALFLCLTLAIASCMVHRRMMTVIFAVMLLSLCLPDELSVTFFAHKSYRGSTRGFELHLADLCALVLAIVMCLGSTNRKISWILPTTYPFCFYLIAAVVSWLAVPGDLSNPETTIEGLPADPILYTSLYPLFEISKMIRGFFVFWVTANFLSDEDEIRYLFYSIAVLVIYFTLLALYERYHLGENRVSALSNVNVFNVFIGMLGIVFLPQGFASKSILKSFFYFFLFISALVCIILTISRSSLFGYVCSSIIIGWMCFTRYKSYKNYWIISAFLFVCVVLFLKSAGTLSDRFNEGVFNDGGRAEYIQEAIMMADDHFFGVGVNNFSAYSIAKYADLVDTEKGAMVHNIWYLTMAEVGYIGFIPFVILWLRYFQILFSSLKNKYVRSIPFIYAVVLGVFGAVMILQLQNWYHFAYRQTSVFLLSHIYFGLIVRIYLDYCFVKVTKNKSILNTRIFNFR